MYNLLKHLMVFFIITITNFTYALGNQNIPTAKVIVIPHESGVFTLQIKLKNNNVLRTNWRLGFFMFHVLAKPNDALKMKICQNHILQQNVNEYNRNCTEMRVIARDNKIVGHINLITPIYRLPLKPYKSYTISIGGLNNIPRNISAMPQQLFFYDFRTKVYSYVNVLSYDYKYYNQALYYKQSESTNLSNWNAYKTEPIKSYVLPTPVMVSYGHGFNAGNDAYMVYVCDKNLQAPDGLKLCKKIINKPEGYVLSIESNRIYIYANTEAGVFYARQTIKQLEYYYPNHLPVQTIVDYPRFKYRGIMLDTVRHFFSVTEVKKLLDIMAENKLNTLHLHLADDEGWRVQVRNYPELTMLGSERGGRTRIPASNLIDYKYDVTNVNRIPYEKINDSYGGFYSIGDIKSLIQYANDRQITIIPEIEMPSHAMAMKLSLPYVLIESTDSSRYIGVQGYTDNVLPVCKYGVDGKFTTAIDDITKTVAQLFNHQKTVYALNNEISLSGDEVPHGAYDGLSYCKTGKFIGLDDEAISHQYFKLISRNLSQNKLSGWQQLVQRDDGNVIESLAVPSPRVGHVWVWLPTKNIPVSGYVMAGNLLKHGYPVVVDFADYTYFDIRYAPFFYEPGLYWSTNYSGTYNAFNIGNDINKLYSESGLSKSNLNNLLGIEGAMWTELVPNSQHLWYMMLPKMTGLAEAGWVQKSDLNWRSLAIELGCGNLGFLSYLYDNYGVRYRGYPYGISNEVPPFVCGRFAG